MGTSTLNVIEGMTNIIETMTNTIENNTNTIIVLLEIIERHEEDINRYEKRISDLEQKVYRLRKYHAWRAANIEHGWQKENWTEADLIDFDSFEFEEEPVSSQIPLSSQNKTTKPRKLPPAYPKVKVGS